LQSRIADGTVLIVDLHFSDRADGIIEVSLGPEFGQFNMALTDAVSSRAPRGARYSGLSTHWIDRTEAAARRAAENDDATPFASGNATHLRLDGTAVVAGWEFDPDERDAQSIPLADFLGVLSAWRQRVIEAGGVHGRDAELVDGDSPTPMGPVA
jgi:hypothetical protein